MGLRLKKVKGLTGVYNRSPSLIVNLKYNQSPAYAQPSCTLPKI